MAQTKEPATNERIVRLLEEIKEQLADVSKRQEEMAHDLTRLLKHALRRTARRVSGWRGEGAALGGARGCRPDTISTPSRLSAGQPRETHQRRPRERKCSYPT